MRSWIMAVLTNEALFADFISWATEIEASLAKSMVEAAQAGDMVKVASIASEVSVYAKMRSRFTTEKRELRAVSDFMENNTKER